MDGVGGRLGNVSKCRRWCDRSLGLKSVAGKFGHGFLRAATTPDPAKRDLRLPQLIAQLDRYDWVVLDDIGYVQHDRDESD